MSLFEDVARDRLNAELEELSAKVRQMEAEIGALEETVGDFEAALDDVVLIVPHLVAEALGDRHPCFKEALERSRR